MALHVYFLLSILAASTITQAAYLTEYEEIAKANFPALFTDNAFNSSTSTLSSRASIPECLQVCAIGYYVGEALLNLKNTWYAIIEERKKDLEKCSTLQNPEEAGRCVKEAENKAQKSRYGFYRSAFSLSIAVFAFGVKFISACIS